MKGAPGILAWILAYAAAILFLFSKSLHLTRAHGKITDISSWYMSCFADLMDLTLHAGADLIGPGASNGNFASFSAFSPSQRAEVSRRHRPF